jgi:tetratricopeptide (TPR) repeat protein
MRLWLWRKNRAFFNRLILFPLLCAMWSVARSETTDYIHYRLGVKYQAEHKYDQALDEFRRVLAAYPDNYNAYMNIAEIRFAQNQSRLAVFNLKKALVYNPGWSKAYRMLAQAYTEDRQFQNAIKEWQEFQQVCDPAEADSVQRVIDGLIKAVRNGGIREVETARADSVTAPAPVDSIITAPKSVPVKSPRRTTVRHPVAGESANSTANEDFKRAVVAYQDGVNNQDATLFEKSLDYLAKTLAVQPDHAGAFYYAGLIRRRFAQNAMAKVNFEKSLSYPELGYNAHFYLGKIYGEEANYPVAIDHLTQYAQATDFPTGKREAQSLITRYQSLLNAKKADTVTVDIKSVSQDALHDEISKIPPPVIYSQIEVRIDSLLAMVLPDTLSDAGQAMLAGVRRFSEGSFDGAIEKFKETQAAFPRGDVAAFCLYDMGICYFKLRDFGSAENMFRQVISRYPGKSITSKSHFFNAIASGEKHDLKTAETLLRRFVQAYPDHPWIARAWERLGDTYDDLEQRGKAIDAYGLAVQKAPLPADRIYALFKQGGVYMTLDNAPAAVECWKKVIAEGEKNGVYERVPDAYYKLADYLYKKGNLDAALDYYLRVTRKYTVFQDTPWGLFQIAGIHKKKKNFEKAVQTYNDLIQRFPDDYWARQAQWKKEDAVWENEYGAVVN